MKNAKLISIISIVLAVVLLACGAVLGFDRGSDIGGTYVLSVQLNEKFQVKDIEAIMKEAGATGCIVQTVQKTTVNEFDAGEGVLISFEVEDDTKAQEVADKAQQLISDKYFLAFPGEFEFFSSTFNRQTAIKMWPVAIVFIALLAYAFIRFGLKMGLTFILDMFIPTAITAGLIAIIGIKVTNFTIPALLIVMALSFMFTFVFAMLLKDYKTKYSIEEAFNTAIKQVSSMALIVSLITIVAFTVLLIIGSALIKNFAIVTIMGVAINMATIIYVLPSLANNKKA
ncbi:MAG: hypothetical protein E7365_01255 [Clostridiales bacterium]|nr:hypothetical protein [Clostridiales bacterium]